MMRGHNETVVRLAMLADQAKGALHGVAVSEEEAIMSWLFYGEILNEARGLMPSNEQFGKWIDENGCRQVGGNEVHDHEREAAMWAAANREDFDATRAACNARTVRGIHAKWKELEAERERAKLEAKRRAEAESQSERTNREDGAIGREGYAPDGSSRLPSGRTDGPSNTGETVAEAESAMPDCDAAAGDSPAPDPYGYANLTEEALLDLANGLRASLDEEKAKRKKAEADAKALKDRLADFTDSDSHEVIRRLQAKVKHMEGERFRADEKFAAEKRRTYALKKEIKSITGQEIEL